MGIDKIIIIIMTIFMAIGGIDKIFGTNWDMVKNLKKE